MKRNFVQFFQILISILLLSVMISCGPARLPVGRYEAKVMEKSIFSGEPPHAAFYRVDVRQGSLIRYEYQSELLEEPTIIERKMPFENDCFLDPITQAAVMKYNRKNKTIILLPMSFPRRPETILHKVK